jgi:hypothetical protein
MTEYIDENENENENDNENENGHTIYDQLTNTINDISLDDFDNEHEFEPVSVANLSIINAKKKDYTCGENGNGKNGGKNNDDDDNIDLDSVVGIDNKELEEIRESDAIRESEENIKMALNSTNVLLANQTIHDANKKKNNRKKKK